MQSLTIDDVMAMSKRTKFGDDCFRLYGLAIAHRPKVIVELGTHLGSSTRALLYAAQDIDAHVISFDINAGWAKSCDGHPRWRFVCADSTKPETADKEGFDRIDLLFIDTSHTAENTRQELRIWLPRLTSKGVAVFHDVKTCFAGVRVPIQEYMDESGEYWMYYEYPESQHGLGVMTRCLEY